MSCPDATAPINIVPTIADECDLKCDYSYNYNTTSIIADNKGSFIRLGFDPDNVPPVSFNKVKYTTQEARIYQPSLHTFSGKHTAGELVIVHQSDTTAQTLLVCVPIIGDSNSKGSILDALITQVANGAPREGSRTSVSIPSFSLNQLVPGKPYYSYSGTLPYAPCNGNVDYVVYADNYGITLSSNVLSKLNSATKSIIQPQTYSVHNNPNGYFYNQKGPSPFEGGQDEIYIECNPTGDDGKVLVPEGGNPKNDNMNILEKLNNLVKNPIFGGLLGLILIYALIQLFDMLANKIFPDSSQAGGSVFKSPSVTGKT